MNWTINILFSANYLFYSVETTLDYMTRLAYFPNQF